MELLAAIAGIAEAVLAALQIPNWGWVAEQLEAGNVVPFATWTLFAVFTGGIAGFIAGLKHAKFKPKFLIMRGMDSETARAALRAFDAGGKIPANEHYDAVVRDAKESSGVFEFEDDSPIPVDERCGFWLSSQWRRYLSRSRRRKKLMKIAGR